MSIDGSISIGNVALATPWILAPMSGVTNSAYRMLIKRLNPGALGLVVTELISVEALVRDNAQTMSMMSFAQEERPISIQIFGYDIDNMVSAAQRAQDAGADIVDINCGCPAPKVIKKGGGCSLMREPKYLAAMLEAVARSIEVPLTLKIRAGWDENSKNAIEVGYLAQESGAQMLAVHGRTRTQAYRGEADWDLVRELSDRLSIPVVGSGDITSGSKAEAALQSGAMGVMVGRASLHNPWIFSEIQAHARGQEWVPPSDISRLSVLREYLKLLLEVRGHEKGALGPAKQLASQITKSIRGSHATRSALCRAKSLNEFVDEISRCEMGLGVA